MEFINIGFGSMVSRERVVAIVGPDSAPIRRMTQESRERGMLIDATYGRKTASIFIMDSDRFPEWLEKRRAALKTIKDL